MFRRPGDLRPSSSFVVAVTVLLFAAAVWTRAQDPLPTEPTAPAISCPDGVKAGEGLYGCASDPDQPVVVTARTLNGLLGSPDSAQEGGVNNFCFPTDGLVPGMWIILSALDANGQLSLKFVRVTS
jgi:hypothetical protein